MGVIHFVKFHFIHSFHIFEIEDSYTRYQNKKVQGTISFPPSPPPASWLLCRQCSWDLVSSKTVSSIPKWSCACSIFFLFKMRILPFAFFHLKCISWRLFRIRAAFSSHCWVVFVVPCSSDVRLQMSSVYWELVYSVPD